MNIDRFVSKITAAMLQISPYCIKHVGRKEIVYDESSGHVRFFGPSGKVLMNGPTLCEHLYNSFSDKDVDKTINTFDEIVNEFHENVYDQGYHYFIIPKPIMTTVMKYIDTVKSNNIFAFNGKCRIKSKANNMFRDNENIIRFRYDDEYDFIAYFYGCKAFIFVKTNINQEGDIMFKLDNPWQFNKYFIVKKQGELHD